LAAVINSDEVDVNIASGGFDGAVTGTFWQSTQPVSGTVTANLSGTDNAVLDAMVVDLAAIEVLLTGIDSDTNTIQGAVSGSEMQVDIVSSATLSVNSHAVTNTGTFAVQSTLQAGSAAIGKLAANSGVDIGDVDVTSISAGTNAIGKVGHDITGLQSDNNEGVDDTTAEALGGSQACKRVDMQADSANTGYIYVGGTDVSATKGIRLAPGDFYSVDIDNVADIFVLASVDEEDIHFTYYT